MNIVTDNSAVIAGLNERIAELEKERDEIMEENASLRAYAFRVIAFVTRSVEKLRGIPEFKPTGDVLNRVLRLTPKTAMESHDLEQQATACDWVYKNVPDLSNGNYMVIQNRARQLRNKAKALTEQGK